MERLVSPVISQAVERAKNRGASVNVRLGEKLGPVRVDREGFERLFTFLLFNAVEMSNQGDSIVVEGHSEPDRVYLSLMHEIQDMSPAALKNVFVPFFTTKRSGLGLAVASRIIEDLVGRLGGRVLFTAEPGKGKGVSITVPVTGPEA